MVFAGSLQLPGVVVTPLASDSDPPSLPDLQPETGRRRQRVSEIARQGRGGAGRAAGRAAGPAEEGDAEERVGLKRGLRTSAVLV